MMSLCGYRVVSKIVQIRAAVGSAAQVTGSRRSVGLNAEKEIGTEPKGSCFLDIPFIGLSRFPKANKELDNILVAEICSPLRLPVLAPTYLLEVARPAA
jgi:hypothetical protein